MSQIPLQRHRFAIPRDVHYFNCGYMSPIAHPVHDATAAGARRKRQPWSYSPAEYFSYCEHFRSRAARLMVTDSDSIAIIPSVSYGLAIAARNLPLKVGQEIVVLADQFPSNVYIWRELAQECGATVVSARRDSDTDWTDAVLDAINQDTAIVAVPNCHWADGRLVDLVAVSRACRAVGAALVLDLTQSLGVLPFDISSVRPDFAVAACYKWLLGPYGLGLLYVDPKYHGGKPIEYNWINRAGSEDFSRLVDYQDAFQPGARRFDMGEKSNPPLLAGGSAAIDMILEWGVDSVAETLAAKTKSIADSAQTIGFDSAPSGTRASHFLALEFAGQVPADLLDHCAENSVFVSHRSNMLRITPHLYNDEVDAAKLLEVLAGMSLK